MLEILESRIAPAVLADLFQFANAAGTVELVTTDGSGNIYFAGTFTGTVGVAGGDIVSVTTTDPLGDVYYGMFLPTGQLSWLRKWGGPGVETVADIKKDSNGDIFITGSFDSTGAGFDGSGSLATTAGHPQLYLFKTDGSGDALTAFDGDGQIQFGDPVGSARGRSLAIGANAIYVGGTFNGLVDLGNITLTTDGDDGVVLSLDKSSGAFTNTFATLGVLQLEFGSSANDSLFRIELGSDGSVFVGLDTEFINPPVPIPKFSSIQKIDGATGVIDSIFGGGSPLPVGSNGAETDFAIDSSNRVISALLDVGGAGSGLSVFRFDATGTLDSTFGGSGGHFINVNAQSVTLLLDAQDRIYIGGVTANANYVARIGADGTADPIFGSSNFASFTTPAIFGKRASLQNPHLGMAIDPNGYLILRDAYTGATTDLDPTNGVRKLAPRTGLGAGMEETFIARVDLNAIGSGQKVRIFAGVDDNNVEQEYFITLTGPGSFRLGQDLGNGNLTGIELFDTTLASTLSVTSTKLFSSRTIGKIIAAGPQQHIGAIKLGPRFILGDGIADAVPDLLVTGKMNALVLGDVAGNAIIKLGVDLPYNVPTDTTTPDTYNNRPTLTIGTIFGADVVIENIGDGTPQGVGGGGFGNIVITSWSSPGFLRTTQSIGNFTILQNDFMAVLEIDKFHNGEGTIANTGMMTVQDGTWGSSGTEVEGYVAGFNADAFLAGATITAGGIGNITTDEGDFNGTLTLTDAAANAVPAFTVATDFTGKIISASPLKKIVIKGNFKGSLTAPSIAAITAFSFQGSTTGDTDGDGDKLNITATTGLLGLITSKSGVIENFEFKSQFAPFSGIKVALKNIGDSFSNPVVGVKNVKITAPSIGAISVSLTATPNNTAVNLIGIADSIFTSTAALDAKIGAITVKLANANGSSTGIADSSFNGGIIGNVMVNVAKGKSATAAARAIHNVDFIAAESLGKLTVLGNATQAQVDDLRYISGGKIGAVSIKAVKAEFGVMSNSAILAGQSLDFAGATTVAQIKAKLLGASLTSFSASGAVTGSLIGAGANVGAVTVGGALSESHILAGTRLGSDRAIGGGDDTFQRAAKIAAVTVKGTFSKTSIAAGVNSVNGIYGDNDDALGTAEVTTTQGSEIGAVSIGVGAAVGGEIKVPHIYAIEAAKIAKLLIKGQPPVKDFSVPTLLDIGEPGEGDDDAIVRVL